MLLFDIEKSVRQKYSPKNKYFFASFNNDRGLCRQKYRRSSKFVTWGHTTRVIFRVKICIFERSNEKTHFSKTKIYFLTTPQLYWTTKYESRRENEFLATCHNISSLCDGCWHPLLRFFLTQVSGMVHFSPLIIDIFMFRGGIAQWNECSRFKDCLCPY